MQQALAMIEQHLPAYPLFGNLLDRVRLGQAHHYPCGMGRSYIVIGTNGQVSKCHMAMDAPVTDISVDNPLQEIKLDEHGVQNTAVEHKESCQACQWRYWCAGGCPILNFRLNGRSDSRSPNCEIYQTLIPEILRLEGLRLVNHSTHLH
jgi:uncharacterized protein